MFQPPDVSTGEGGPQVNKFEQVSRFVHQMLPAGERGPRPGPCTNRGNGAKLCTEVGGDLGLGTVKGGPLPCKQNDRHD